MDEPLSNLDAALRVHMRAELSGLHRQLGRTFIYVTHDQAEALTMSDRMAVMMGGEILQLDTPANIYGDPNDLRVAQFVGSPAINLLPGEVDAQGRVSYCGVPLEQCLGGAAQGPVTIGLRPEQLHLATPEQAGALNGRVTFAENLGADTYLHVALEDGAHPVQLRIDSHVAAGLATGSAVHVCHGRGAALIFDGAGKRLRMADATIPTAQRPEMV
jgi:multiple sugar transport system ATP-binding protein